MLRRSAFIEKPAGKSVAMPGADGDALAARGAATAEHGGAGFGLHARPETVCFRTVAAVRLKCTLGHRDPLLLGKENLCFSNINEYIAGEFWNPANERTSRCGKGDAKSRLC